jgi:hypothetical protein
MLIVGLVKNFAYVPGFPNELLASGIGDATTNQTLDIYTEGPLKLVLQVAAHMDLESITAITYVLEGELLKILFTFRRLKSLRELGRSIKDDARAPLCFIMLARPSPVALRFPVLERPSRSAFRRTGFQCYGLYH